MRMENIIDSLLHIFLFHNLRFVILISFVHYLIA